MIGLVVIGYDVLPEAMLVALQCMKGKQEQIVAVSLAPEEEIEKQRQTILDAIEHVNIGEGVLVFTDAEDSAAGYLSLSIANLAEADIISGVNLTMLTKVTENREKLSINDLAKLARDEGRKGITWLAP